MRFEVRALLNGGGWVIVDTRWEHSMMGCWPMTTRGRARALARAAEFEADPTAVPTASPGTARVAQASDYMDPQG